jgi:ribosomal protein L37E
MNQNKTYEIICKVCGKTFQHENANCTLCFDCSANELIRLRDQAERIDEKLNTCPEICELLDKIPSENILARLKAKWYFSEYNPSINPEQFRED